MEKFTIKNTDFNPTHTLECGQFFRYQKVGQDYLVISGCHRAKISPIKDAYLIECDDAIYFKKFFDTKSDYSIYKRQLKKIDYMIEPIAHGSGIRLLCQPLFETIINFIISQNNNIKRIQGIIERIAAKVGTKTCDEFGEFYAFPTQTQLLKLNESDYLALGLGYRAAYLADTVPHLTDEFLTNLQEQKTPEARKMLMSLKGVGRKVADCILLFGMGRGNVFPVDVWVERVFFQYFGVEAIKYPKIKNSREKMSDFFVNKFGSLSGLVQQYLFYSMREKV